MCDTMVAAPAVTASGAMLFAKNSDRQRNEAQLVELLPASEHAYSKPVRCTYIEIPQVSRTHAVLLCRPFWIWGAEMGANEHGVVIGNEGLLARGPAPEAEALIGMDLLRLGLERSASAAEALKVICDLLAAHGQGGDCGHLTPSFYHNSFLIADCDEAYVLETVGREWMAEKVGRMRAISNAYSITMPISESSGFDALATAFRQDGAAGTYAEIIAAPNAAHISSGQQRQTRASAILAAGSGLLSPHDLMRALRDHDPHGGDTRCWRPDDLHDLSLCVHAGAADRISQTTGSLVSFIARNRTVHWVTGTSAPCLSIFKPVLMHCPIPEHGPPPTDEYDARTLWWRHEHWHRRALAADFACILRDFSFERDALEARMQQEIDAALEGGSARDQAAVVTKCWHEALALEDRMAASVPSSPVVSSGEGDYDAAWRQLSARAGVAGVLVGSAC